MNVSGFKVRFFEAVQRHRFFVLLGFAFFFVVASIAGRRIVWREDVADLLPDHDSVVRDYRRLLDTFRPADRTYLVIQPSEGFPSVSDGVLYDGADRLTSRLEAIADESVSSTAPLLRVFSRSDPAEALAVLDWMRARRASYFSAEDARIVEEKLRSESVRAALAGWKKQMSMSPTPTLGRRMAGDPLGLDGLLAVRLESLRSMGGGVRVRDGRLLSAEGRGVLIIAEPRWPSTDSRHARAYIGILDAAIAAVSRETGGQVRVSYLSGHRFALENAVRVKADVRMVVALSVVGVSLLAYLVLGRLVSVVLVLLPAAFGAAFSLGILGVAWPDISAIALGCGAMLVGISVDYGIHLLYHASLDDAGTGAVARTAARLTEPLLLSALTTVAAFSVLGFSALPGYRQLGVFASLGILGAGAFALVALPALMGRGATLHRGRFERPMSEAFLRLRNALAARRGWLIAAVSVVTLMSGAGLFFLRFEGDYRRLNGISDVSRREWQDVEAAFGNVLDSASAMAPGRSLDEALGRNERLTAAIAALEKAGVVRAYRSIAAVFPSSATRSENEARWRAFWSVERTGALRRDLAAISREMGIRPEAFELFLESLDAPVPIFPERDAMPRLLAEAVRAQVATDASGAAVLLPLRLADEARLDAVALRVREVEPEALFASGQGLMRHMVRLIAYELRRIGFFAMLAVAFVLFAAWRRPLRVIGFLLPVALSVLWTLGFLGWAGVGINLMNSIVCVFIFGLVVDYSVFVLSADWRAGDRHFAAAAGSVALSALTTLTALGALTVARHPALRSVGLTAMLGIGTGWLAVMLVASIAAPRDGVDGPRRES